MANKETNIKADPKKWVERFGDLMFKYTLPRVNDHSVAEDLVQETFLSALKNLDGFKGEASEKNWLFTILKNKIVDYYRKKANKRITKELPGLQNVPEDFFNNNGQWHSDRKPRGWHAADEELERKEFQNVINKCKDDLKDLQQQVFTLKYMEEINSDEICKVLGISPSNYWVLLHRARLQMRNCVEKHWLKT
jgi:RNA polymerase sigma-70 factor (TIGR02943 family)